MTPDNPQTMASARRSRGTRSAAGRSPPRPSRSAGRFVISPDRCGRPPRSSTRPARSRHCLGFSLLEVMIAVAILAVSFLTLLNFQGQTMFRLSRAEKLTQATFLAQGKMAEVFLQIEKEAIQQKVFPDDKSDNGTFEEPYENYQWEWTLRKVEIPTPGGEAGEEGGGESGGGMMMAMMRMVTTQIKDMVREIKLTVKWEELGKERNLDVVTHISKL